MCLQDIAYAHMVRPVTTPILHADALVTIVGRRIRAERTNRNLTMAQLAALANVGTRTLLTIELGQAATSLTTLELIARALDVPVASLVST